MAKICLVIGGTGGLGKACAEYVGAKGYTVVVSGRNKTKGDEAVDAIKSKGGKAEFMACDLTSEQEIRDLHKNVVGKYGRIDVAINSAGITLGLQSIVKMPLSDFTGTIQTNLTATFISMQEQLRAMLVQQPSTSSPTHIINLASIFGLHGCPWGSDYAASKHAIVGLTRSAALEVANQNICVNAIAPGVIPTGMIDDMMAKAEVDADFAKIGEAIPSQYPMGRFGTTDQVAKAVGYLLECDWVTGTVLEVDGGYGAGKSLPVGMKCTVREEA